MAIELLKPWVLRDNKPSFYDTESLSTIEMAGRLHGAMNELIADYNKYVEDTNKLIAEFTTSANKDRETFEIAMRQEFQDFIDVVSLKYDELVSLIENNIEEVSGDFIRKTTNETIKESIENGSIVASGSYNENTESLEIVLSYKE